MQNENYNKYEKINKSKSRKVWKKLLKRIEPAKGYSTEEYYGVAILRLKKNGSYQIKLIHDYEKHSIMSSAIITETQNEAMKIYLILDWFSKDDSLRAASTNDINLDEEEDEVTNDDFDNLLKQRS